MKRMIATVVIHSLKNISPLHLGSIAHIPRSSMIAFTALIAWLLPLSSLAMAGMALVSAYTYMYVMALQRLDCGLDDDAKR